MMLHEHEQKQWSLFSSHSAWSTCTSITENKYSCLKLYNFSFMRYCHTSSFCSASKNLFIRYHQRRDRRGFDLCTRFLSAFHVSSIKILWISVIIIQRFLLSAESSGDLRIIKMFNKRLSSRVVVIREFVWLIAHLLIVTTTLDTHF